MDFYVIPQGSLKEVLERLRWTAIDTASWGDLANSRVVALLLVREEVK